MVVYIPSYNRYTEKLAKSVKFFSQCKFPVFIIVRNTQLAEYRKLVKGTVIKIVVTKMPGVISARNRCLKHAIKHGHDRILMSDDDLRFYNRVNGKLQIIDNPDALVSYVSTKLDRYAHVALSNRFANNYTEENEIELGRGVRCVAYRVDILEQNGIWFELEGREGMHMTLRLHRLGYPNLVVYNYSQESVNKNVFDKGDNTTLEWTERTAQQLVAEHPDIVKYIEKKYKSGTRGEVRVAWKKSLKNGPIYLDV